MASFRKPPFCPGGMCRGNSGSLIEQRALTVAREALPKTFRLRDIILVLRLRRNERFGSLKKTNTRRTSLAHEHSRIPRSWESGLHSQEY